MNLNAIWFVLIVVVLTGYAVLDGFDLGVGILHLFATSDDERRIILNAIGPVWDGNEVWLVTGGGALFAAFPEVYASVFSGFYLPFMLLLLCLILRAVSIEFRSKQPMKWWRQLWDVLFGASSCGASFVLGVAFGNIINGIPLSGDHLYIGSLLQIFNPYALLVGLTTVILFMLHGANYLGLKTEGTFLARVRRWAKNGAVLFILCYAGLTLATVFFVPHLMKNLQIRTAWALPLLIINVGAVVHMGWQIHHKRSGLAFISSGFVILSFMAIIGVGLFPNIVYSFPDPQNSLTIGNAASSQKTLGIMLTIAAIGMPLVLVYTAVIYWIFRGRVRLTPQSY